MAGDALLEIEDLRVRLTTAHGPVDAVRGISFTLQAGETAGLVGESGCGKSLTAMSLMGLGPEHARIRGTVRFLGTEMTTLTERQWCAIRGKKIGMIFQEPMSALNPVHTVGHQIAEPLRLHMGLDRHAARKRAIELLDRVGIAHASRRVDAWPHQFSGGQRQRITIAMALACEPCLLIADEPTTALDVTVAGQILELIGELVRERHMALLMISHDLGVIANHVERTMVMYAGTIVESGPTAAVFRAPSHPYTQGLMGSRPQLSRNGATTPGARKRLPAIAGFVPRLHDLPEGCAFAPRCPRATDLCAAAPPPVWSREDHHRVACIHRSSATP